MARVIEWIKSIDQRIVAGAVVILSLICLCGSCIFVLPLTAPEPTASVAQDITSGESAGVEERVITVELPETAVIAGGEQDTVSPTIIARPSNTARPTNTPQPARTLRPTNTPLPANTIWPTNTPLPANTVQTTGIPTPLSPTSTITSPPTVPSGDLATVTYIVDGDTIDVDLGGTTYRLRYIGMDTPERGDYFFNEATDANRALVAGQQVILVKDVSETDQYGRLLRYVYLEDGTFVNAELVRQGYAVIATFPPDVRHQDLFLQLQQEARDAGRGLWAQPGPTTPPPTSAPAPTSPPAPLPTNPPQPTQPPSSPGNVQITYIYFDGQEPQTEGDEYAVIQNVGGSAVNLSGWRLNADDPGQDFWFPSYDLQPGQSCRVYTNIYAPEYCGFNYANGQALWNNGGECGHLFDPNGLEVSTYCY